MFLRLCFHLAFPLPPPYPLTPALASTGTTCVALTLKAAWDPSSSPLHPLCSPRGKPLRVGSWRNHSQTLSRITRAGRGASHQPRVYSSDQEARSRVLCPPLRLGHRFRTTGVSRFWRVNVSLSVQRMDPRESLKTHTTHTHVLTRTYRIMAQGETCHLCMDKLWSPRTRVYTNTGIHRHTRSCTQSQAHTPSPGKCCLPGPGLACNLYLQEEK